MISRNFPTISKRRGGSFLDHARLRSTLALLVLCLTLQAATESWAAQGGGNGNGTHLVKWSSLELTSAQMSEIERLELSWKKLYGELYPQIVRDKAELRRLLHSAQSDEKEIMALQARIQDNEERLRTEATRSFLAKKGQLTPQQKLRLQEMLSP